MLQTAILFQDHMVLQSGKKVMIWGTADSGTHISDDMTQAITSELLPGNGTEKELYLISVCNHISESYPPVFFMTCPGDFLKDHAPVLAAKLAEKNVPFIYRMYGNSENTLTHVFHCDIKSSDAALCNVEECNFFRRFL